ncbi:hypothetical protein [Sporomusa silvacetica]|nr:hypothetical protein [Sporomusa silvacetica]
MAFTNFWCITQATVDGDAMECKILVLMIRLSLDEQAFLPVQFAD